MGSGRIEANAGRIEEHAPDKPKRPFRSRMSRMGYVHRCAGMALMMMMTIEWSRSSDHGN